MADSKMERKKGITDVFKVKEFDEEQKE